MLDKQKSFFKKMANFLIRTNYPLVYKDEDDLVTLLENINKDKIEQDELTDSLLDFNDEIVSIEEFEEEYTIDISVSKDSLFYANGILTKNSFGTAATADIVVGIIATDELDEVGQIAVKPVKNRYGVIGDFYKLNIEKAKMRIFDADVDPATYQLSRADSTPVFKDKQMEKKLEKLQDISNFVEEVEANGAEGFDFSKTLTDMQDNESKEDKFSSFNI